MVVHAMRTWTARQWLAASISAVAIALAMGMATGIIDNPVFARMIATPWWAYPVWLLSAVLLGLLVGTYVSPAGQHGTVSGSHQRRSLVAALLAWFAVGCPTCNALVVLALGTSGAVAWFQPLQPVLALLSLVLLGAALRSRLRNAESCPSPRADLQVRT